MTPLGPANEVCDDQGSANDRPYLDTQRTEDNVCDDLAARVKIEILDTLRLPHGPENLVERIYLTIYKVEISTQESRKDVYRLQ